MPVEGVIHSESRNAVRLHCRLCQLRYLIAVYQKTHRIRADVDGENVQGGSVATRVPDYRRVIRPWHKLDRCLSFTPLHQELSVLPDEKVSVRLVLAGQITSAYKDSEAFQALTGKEEYLRFDHVSLLGALSRIVQDGGRTSGDTKESATSPRARREGFIDLSCERERTS